MFNSTKPFFRFGKALAVCALFLPTIAPAHQTNSEFDRFENAVQCAGLWLGDYAAWPKEIVDGVDVSDSRMSRALGSSFRDYAIETGEGSEAEIDYLISVWVTYFTILAEDGGGARVYPPVEDGTKRQWAGAQFLRHTRYCQGFGLTLGPKWGFH